jgi:hypothetical protein
LKLLLLAGFVYLAWPAAGGDLSYVVLNGRSSQNGLVRVSADGKSMITIARRASGSGLAKDHDGNYIVASVHWLLRVTPAGEVTTIAEAPGGSQWMSVTLDAAGNFFVSDNVQHAVWRVSPDGAIVAKLWTYPIIRLAEMEDTSMALDSRGNLVLVEDNGFSAHLFRISAAGEATPIPLSRALRRVSSLMIDSQGNYVLLDYADCELLRVTLSGNVNSIARMEPRKNMTAFTQDPETGDYVVAVNFAHGLFRMGASQSGFLVVNNHQYLNYPTAVIVEQSK